MSKDIVFIYDFLQVKGGAEQFALNIARNFGQVQCIFAAVDHETFPNVSREAAGFRALTTMSRNSGLMAVKALHSFKSGCAFLQRYDTVVYSGVYAPVAIRHHVLGRNVYYCHTPPRFVYDLRSFYRQKARIWQRPVLDLLARYVEQNYRDAVMQMDTVIANSMNVRNRLSKYLGLSDVSVMHPPVDTERFSWLGQGDYYLSTARLEPYKRVDLIVRAFLEMPRRNLVVASGGSQLTELKKLAAEARNITFTGWCSESELRKLVGNCIATIYVPIDEDFGMSPVESMAAGKPVIGVDEGGLRETIVHDETGFLIACSPGSLSFADEKLKCRIIEAVSRMSKTVASNMRSACEKRALLFSIEVFNRKFRSVIEYDA